MRGCLDAEIWVTETYQRISELMTEVACPDGATIGPLQVSNVDIDVLASFYKARPTTIYGNSNETQHSVNSRAWPLTPIFQGKEPK